MTQDRMKQKMPELEISDKQTGAIRYLEHGSPHWRIRWHYHDEYELHLIVASSGRMFIGDYIGNFQPGCLVLTGPRVPHNWISIAPDGTHYELRDHIVHFDHDAIVGAANLLPELRMLLTLLERAKYGIEFRYYPGNAEKYMLQIKESDGAARLGYFCELMDMLARCPHQQLLSASQINLLDTKDLPKKIDFIVDYVTKNHKKNISLTEVATLVGMSEGHVSRFFRKATGNRFKDFVSRVRIAKACDLLSQTDMAITVICYEVGFRNVANFNRRFGQYKQMSPSQYRKQVRQRYNSQEGLA